MRFLCEFYHFFILSYFQFYYGLVWFYRSDHLTCSRVTIFQHEISSQSIYRQFAHLIWVKRSLWPNCNLCWPETVMHCVLLPNSDFTRINHIELEMANPWKRHHVTNCGHICIGFVTWSTFAMATMAMLWFARKPSLKLRLDIWTSFATFRNHTY